jgi:hypothetical protein
VNQDLVPWIMLFATLFAAMAAIFTYLHARAVTKSAMASNLINCLDAYIKLMRDRTKAEDQKSEKLVKDYYRELFDLHWTEFHLWQQGLIPESVMNAWLAVRRRNYTKDAIEFETINGQKVNITYRQIWDQLLVDEYFEPADPFVKFMKKAHTEVITNMKQLRKETKK